MNRSGFITSVLISLSFVIAMLISCAVNPVTGKTELMLLSESDEIQLGRQSDKEIVAQYGLYNDQELQTYIEQLGQTMVKVSHRPNLAFSFRLLDSPVINAFAVPGGYVYITRGILAYLNNEAELAGVMGHEIGHVTARHSAKQYTKAQIAQVGLGVGTILSEDFRKYSGLAQVGVGLIFLRFSRDAERQADDLGVQYSTEVGYDAREMANFFHTLDQMNPSEDKGGLPGWLSTHPNPADRVVAVRADAAEWQAKVGNQNLKVNRDIFLQKINGIVFGDDPRQGYVENNVFYHPDLTFEFPVPAGWKVNNTPTQVQMASEKQDAVILFEIAQGNTPAEAANNFINQSKVSVISSEGATVSGLSAHKLISDLSSDQGTIRILSYFIRKGDNIFVFHGFTAQASFSQHQPTFQNTMTGFKTLTDQSKINVKPDRIVVKKVSQITTLEQALRSFGVEEDKLGETALLNGMELPDSVPAGTLIKYIEKGT